MSEEKDKISDGEREALSSIAGDSLQIFRAGLFLIVIYISILSLTLRTGGPDYVRNIIDSFYTINGIIFWIGSVTGSVLTYRTARRVTLQENYSQLGRIHDKFEILNFSTACTFGLLISVFSLIFGLLEGYANTVSGSSEGIGIEQPLVIVGFSFILVMGIYSLLSVIEMARDKWGPIRKILRMS